MVFCYVVDRFVKTRGMMSLIELAPLKLVDEFFDHVWNELFDRSLEALRRQLRGLFYLDVVLSLRWG
jgi:hypothetical protein